MAKKRVKVGAFLKSKDPKFPPYLKFEKAVKEGEFIRVENAKFQLESATEAHTAGKLNDENYAKTVERIQKIPEFVIAELAVLQDIV